MQQRQQWIRVIGQHIKTFLRTCPTFSAIGQGQGSSNYYAAWIQKYYDPRILANMSVEETVLALESGADAKTTIQRGYSLLQAVGRGLFYVCGVGANGEPVEPRAKTFLVNSPIAMAPIKQPVSRVSKRASE